MKMRMTASGATRMPRRSDVALRLVGHAVNFDLAVVRYAPAARTERDFDRVAGPAGSADFIRDANVVGELRLAARVAQPHVVREPGRALAAMLARLAMIERAGHDDRFARVESSVG